MKNLTYNSIVLIVLFTGFLFFSCAKKEEAVQKPKTFEAVGVIVSVDKEGGYITINHEEIVGFMAAMTMPFSIADSTIVTGFQKDDKINFTLEVTDSKFIVTKIKKIDENLE